MVIIAFALYTYYIIRYNKYNSKNGSSSQFIQGGEKMVTDIGMTDKQFLAFTRLVKFVTKIIFELVKDEELKKQLEKELDDILQSILEDGN